MRVLLKFELFIKTVSSSGTYFSSLKLTVTSSSAVLKATKYPGLPLFILQHTCMMTEIWPSHTSVCIQNVVVFLSTSHHLTPSSILKKYECSPKILMVSLVHKNSFLFHTLIFSYAPPRDTQPHLCNISPTSCYTLLVFCSSTIILHTTKNYILLSVTG